MSDALFDLGWDRPAWTGRPLVFTPEPLSLEEVEAMDREWIESRDGQDWRPSRLWTPMVLHRVSTMPGHALTGLHVDLGCTWLNHPDDDRDSCQHVGQMLYRFSCSCGADGPIVTSENAMAESWADLHWPGWRDLPPIPLALPRHGSEKQHRARWQFMRDHYPEPFWHAGAPCRMEREPVATRHVPGGAPMGGYEFAVVLP